MALTLAMSITVVGNRRGPVYPVWDLQLVPAYDELCQYDDGSPSMQFVVAHGQPNDEATNHAIQYEAAHIRASVLAYLELKDVVCSKCWTSSKVGNLKLRTKAGFSKMKCESELCGETMPSSQWRCRCKLR